MAKQRQMNHQQLRLANPVLPSDSIIYGDINQVHALSRHQSRYQQTSFELQEETYRNTKSDQGGGGSGGHQVTPVGQAKLESPLSSSSRSHVKMTPATATEMLNGDSGETSGSDSPQTVMENNNNNNNNNNTNRTIINSNNFTESARGRSSSLAKSGHTAEVAQDTRYTVNSSRRTSLHHQNQQTTTSCREPENELPSSSTAATTTTTRRQSLARASNNQQPATSQDLASPTNRRALVRQEASRAEPQVAGRNSVISRQSSNADATSAGGGGGGGGGELSRQASNATAASYSSSSNNSSSRSHRQTVAESSSRRSSRRNQQQQQHQQVAQGDENETEAAKRQQQIIRRRASKSQPPSRGASSIQQQQQQVDDEDSDLRPTQQVARSKTPNHYKHPSSTSTNIYNDVSWQEQQQQRGHSSQGHHKPRAISVSPSLACNVNIRHILENVAQIEGPFVDPHLALKVSLDAISSPCWSTKVEGIMALIRLVNFHQQTLINSGHLHELVCHISDETRNLRSTVARSAIFALGDMSAKLKRSLEPEMELIVSTLMQKSLENTTFIRDDIRRTLTLMVQNLTPWKLASSLIHHGANHKSLHARRMASQFVAQLVERIGPAKCLIGAKEISSQLIPAAAKFAQDNSPFTRYYGRQILAKLMQHNSFDRLLRHNLSPNLYRSTLGIVESVKRRGPGELPTEN